MKTAATHSGNLGGHLQSAHRLALDKVKEALQHLYKFCSDYPGIRHAGNPAGVRRALATRDLTIASMLILSFSGYLSPQFDERMVLGL